MAWYTRMCSARVLIAPKETRSIHIPTARMVKNAASCKKTKNAKAICRIRLYRVNEPEVQTSAPYTSWKFLVRRQHD